VRFRSLRCLACVMIVAVFVVPAGVFGGKPVPNAAEKQWTILIFWDSDNSLEFTTDFCMHLWETALTSDKDVSIVAFVDIKSVDGAWIYQISGGTSHVVKTWPEMNSSDPAVLETFVSWGMDNYPAQKTMLVMSDHGYGWRGVCEDETNGDVLMPMNGIRTALTDVKASTGKGVDLLAFDACNMATIEVAYELRGVVPYMVGSETTVPFDGLPYQMMITEMVAYPEISPADLATGIVHDYVLYYSSKWDYSHQVKYTQDFATMAAVDLSKMQPLGDAFQALANVLKPLIQDNMKKVEDARGYALLGMWSNMAGYEWMPDLYTFVDGLRAIKGHPELTSAIDSFEQAFSDAIIAEGHSAKYHDTVHGLNVWFPPSLSQYNMQGWSWARQFVYNDVGLDLVQGNSPWVQCLMTYYGL
jgi:hypothetical protein